MSSSSFDADIFLTLIPALLALGCLAGVWRAIAAKRIGIAVLWFVGALVCGAVALFFATFQIRLF